MKVVLTQDVPNLGKAGEIKDVADDYARDYLLPKGYAVLATADLFKQALDRLGFQKMRDPKAHSEAELLQKINQGLPQDLHQRYADLIEKRQAELLTDDEYTELVDLTDQVEQLEARRVEYLIELARLRNTSVTDLIQELGIRSPMYA